MLGIVILNYENFILTEQAIESILHLELEKIKILVVDNDSKNDSFNILKKKYIGNNFVEVIKSSTNGGYAKGNNLGIKYLLKKYSNIKNIGIMNPDVKILNKSSIIESIKILDKYEKIASISPVMILNNNIDFSKIAWKIPQKFDDIFSTFSIVLNFYKSSAYKNYCIEKNNDSIFTFVEVLPGSFFIIKSKIFEEIDFFDENTFLYCEERILGKKLKNYGFKQAILLSEYYYHNHIHKPKSLKFELKHLEFLFEARKHFNKNYNEKYGRIVSILLTIILPLKKMEHIIIKILKKTKK